MENTSPFDSFELQLTAAAQGFLRETAKWARFLSIIGFIFVALYIILALMMFAVGGAMGSAEGMGGMGMMGAMGGATLGIIYLLGAILYFFPILYLYRFASKALMAFESNSTEHLTSSLENLKSHYKFMGILMIIVLVLMVLGIIIGIVGGLAAATM